MISAVLDASALLALLQDEPGADSVADVLPSAVISSVNFAEVFGKLAEKGMPTERVRNTLGSLDLNVQPFERALACEAGALRPATRALGLSLGDRVCLALALHLRVPALTTDQTWQRLHIDALAVELLR